MTPSSRHLRPFLFALLPLLTYAAPISRQPKTHVPFEAAHLAIDPAARGAGASENWWQTVSAEITRDEYRASLTSDGLQAPNRAHGLRTWFRTEGIEVVPRQKPSGCNVSWCFSWSTTRWGRESQLKRLEQITPQVENAGDRVLYAHPGLDEWYENTPEGLEQGFTIHARPSGQGRLCLTGEFRGALRAQFREEGTVNLFDDNGACVLRYAELKVWDADGQALPAQLAMHGEELAIQVDDRAARYPITIDPLMTSPAWTAQGDQAGAHFGFAVGTAGDVNGDGFSDVIVSAYVYDDGQTDEGRVFVYQGSATGLAISPAWTAESDQDNAYFGVSVGTAGDVNGDGFSDVIVGAYGYDNEQTDEGRAFVYHGSATGLASAAAWTAESDQADAFFGISVGTAGDVNGDGFSDAVIGAYLYDNGETDEGRVYVYHGSATGLSTSAAWGAQGDQVGAAFGRSVGTAGDVNGDGYSDVIVGAYAFDNGQLDEGVAFVYHGSATGLGLTWAWYGQSNQFNAYYGLSVGTAGDVNGDGYADVIVGVYGYDNGQQDEGAAFVYHGSATGLNLIASPAWMIEGNQAGAYCGVSVGTAGDVNGDGFSDVIVGAYSYDNGQADEGRAFVYYGSLAGLASSPAWTAEGDQASAFFGRCVGTAGDVNGDGFSDIIVGADYYDNGEADEGQAFVYHGAAAGLASSPTWTTESDQVNAEYGTSVATAGDVNGDGYSDVIIGAPFYDGGEVDEGWVFVYNGSPTGLSPSPSWTIEGGQAAAYLGMSVGMAGDVNGDGFSDIIVGAPGFDGAQPDEGKAYVYLGSATGLGLSPAWSTVGVYQLGAAFGYSVASAGDVNGDGYSDVIVGAYQTDAGEPDEGMAFVYHGSASGLVCCPSWTAQSNHGGALFGYSVGTAGDVNGDGYSDVIVGAYGWTQGSFVQFGQVFVYQGTSGGLTSSATWNGVGDDSGDRFGISVGTAGDVNGDGYSDVIIGASEADNVEGREGQAYIYQGTSSGLSTTRAWTGESNQQVALYGISVGTAGDVNGDGYSDVIVGAYYYDNGQTDEGRAYVYQGSATGLAASPAWTGESDQVNAQYGNSVGTAGDVNGDGYSDVIVASWFYNNGQNFEGRGLAYYGNEGGGLDCIPRQARTNDAAPIHLLGRSESSSSFRIKALGRSPSGRGKVHLQWEVKRFGTAFNGNGLANGLTFDTGTPNAGTGSAFPLSEAALGLSSGYRYHWRLRIVTDSPFFPHSRWLSLPGNAPSELDVSTAFGHTGVSDSPASAILLLEAGTPNPFSNAIQLAYTLPERGHVRLTIYDISGREVVVLAEGTEESGPHTRAWDGHGGNGARLSDGVYFARLEFGGQVEARKIVLAP